ncbi:DUF3592 domain-containing protein [Streptomyces lavendulae]|uniref:DUF3592 domain-containing protein n=1 Tax=Streptomyces lavendulae TaxID=1914 RepID=UPI0024A2983D|nr:DUF3592 domain-containing protein [Streptomyces lavendulae]GLX22440.1 hypothetical protein Slala01_60840 [Streptomyces lavendulae subsp. lavendulae]GLX29924.1 hypothetical protein Slala02_57440 [Streptomyces lavendulae subsp. lavendulae]
MEHEWLFSLIPLLIGVSFLGVGVYGLRRASALRRSGITAAGRVVRHDTRRDDEGGKYHHPVVAWTARDGREYTYPSTFGRGTVLPGFGTGRSVTVLYDPANPRHFEILGWDSKTFFLVFAGVGTALTAGTLVALLVLVTTL